MLRLAEDDSAHAEGSPSRGVQSALDLYPRLRRLQSGAHAKLDHRIWGRVSPDRAVFAAAWSQNQRPHKPEIQAFDIINDEQQKEKHAANQFFSSLLRREPRENIAPSSPLSKLRRMPHPFHLFCEKSG